MRPASPGELKAGSGASSCAASASLAESLASFTHNLIHRQGFHLTAFILPPATLDLLEPGAVKLLLRHLIETEPEVIRENGALLVRQRQRFSENPFLLRHKYYASVPNSISCNPFPLGTIGYTCSLGST